MIPTGSHRLLLFNRPSSSVPGPFEGCVLSILYTDLPRDFRGLLYKALQTTYVQLPALRVSACCLRLWARCCTRCLLSGNPRLHRPHLPPLFLTRTLTLTCPQGFRMLSAFVGAVLHALLPSRFLTAAQVVARLADRRIGYSEATKMLQVGKGPTGLVGGQRWRSRVGRDHQGSSWPQHLHCDTKRQTKGKHGNSGWLADRRIGYSQDVASGVRDGR